MEQLDGNAIAEMLPYDLLFRAALSRLGYLEVTLDELMNPAGFATMPVEGSTTLRFTTIEEDND